MLSAVEKGTLDKKLILQALPFPGNSLQFQVDRYILILTLPFRNCKKELFDSLADAI